MTTKDIAGRVGVSTATVRRWTKDQREQDKQQRNETVIELAEQGRTQAEIADELLIDQGTVSRIMQNTQMHEMHKAAESVENTHSEPKSQVAVAEEPAVEAEEARAFRKEAGSDSDADETPADVLVESVPESEGLDETPEAEAKPSPPEEIPNVILQTARAVMVGFVESRPDAYVARLEVSASE